MSISHLKNIAAVLLLIFAVAACAASPWKKEQAESHINIGIAYLGSERFNDALKEFMQAEKLTPEDPVVHYYIGIAYHGKVLNDNAIVAFEKAVSLKPDYAEAHNFLGTVYLEKGLWDKAITAFNNALSNVLYDTPDKALFNLGRAYYGKGDYKTALNKYREARNKKPITISPALIEQHMGMAGYAGGDMENAIQYFKNSIAIDPSFLESRYWLGQCYIRLDNSREAKIQFENIIKADQKSELGTAARRALESIGASRYKP
jgi:type IV pilus assembly protein PilF